MAEITLITSIKDSYNELISILPEGLKFAPPLFFISMGIALYGMFIWLFYRFLAEKDVLKLDLKKYNVYKHEGLVKFLRVTIYIFEFMIISPIVIFIWFSIFSIFIIILAKELEIVNVMLICAGMISAIRICAYFKEDLSRDLAKLIPLTLLGVAILTPGFINIGGNISRITQIPEFFNTAVYYLIFIVVLEVILRFLYIPVLWARSKEER
ncbi:hypothetical protein A3K82_02325 [Candidatus Pacearchaeota archaeon RBG_19FT_COMBO_34_9]|nr:MAG: hypothetical protein A3K82_02325 [Candidatus Pacearchaeota archaeon RBG_19FT_COMBO_34_9]OGJ16117.1 MAG: hypothetical protein A3K74_02705 [Candidatus Pacearchaeota archaeon RBG_13_33_26]